ncbi:MAG: acetoacetate metabolism transcriptional regulator AtoC [Thermodesulfovibrionales bacterium]
MQFKVVEESPSGCLDTGKVLVVDEDEALRRLLVDVLRENGFLPFEAVSGREALGSFRSIMPEAVLVGLEMRDMNGIEVMAEIKKSDPAVPVIIVTGFADIPTAVNAIKMGAYDFIVKPPKIDKLVFTLQRAIEKFELKKAVDRLNHAVDTSLEWSFGRSPAMKKVIRQINQVAQSDFSVIIQGETGTGKSFAARAIHGLSKRAERPLVAVDMGSIPETLVESELFGHERGAFTGADERKKGFFAAADGGTLLIDELQNMSPQVQAKLLSAVEERRFYPLGSTRPLEFSARIIAATNSDLARSVREGRFREDLFFRLSDFVITMPPLRERVEDIPFLAQRFIMDAASELGRQPAELSSEAAALLARSPWPGNVRELKNVLRRAVLVSSDVIMPEHIDFLMEAPAGGSAPFLPLRDVARMAARAAEKKAIRQALGLTRGNKSRAAAMLQVDYKTLLTRIKDFGLS